MHVASLVLGIVGILLSLGLRTSGLGLILGALSIVFAIRGKKKLQEAGKPTGVATAGLVLGIIAAALGGIELYYYLISISPN